MLVGAYDMYDFYEFVYFNFSRPSHPLIHGLGGGGVMGPQRMI